MHPLWLFSSAALLCVAAILTAWLWRSDDVTASPGATEPLPPNAFSSLFCEGDTVASRRCLVTNLCFVPEDDQFVLLESADTRYVGVRNATDLQPLLKLNPVVDHNLFDLNLVPVGAGWRRGRGAILHRGRFLVFEPFKPDNLMHALHDDLLPAYLTQFHLCEGEMADCVRRWRPLLRADDLPSSLAPLYGALWDVPPVVTGSLDSTAPHCFERAHLGLRADTLWYQYGFTRPQSPLPNSGLQRQHLDDFRSLLLARLARSTDAAPPPPSRPGYVLLLSRTESRRVLNEAELSEALEARLDLPVRRLALEETPVAAATALAGDASLLVGVHGAALALALLLPPGGAVLELFPLGLRPDLYRPYRRLCQLRRLGYRAWANPDPTASVPHPEAPAELGGLAHLPAAERRRVEALQEVPETLCCADPAFLYRVYQDTVVDAVAAADAAAAALADAGARRRPPRSALFFPGPARNLAAAADSDSRLLEWRAPLNVPADRLVTYRVWVQQGAAVSQYKVRRPQLRVPLECADCELRVWVRVEMDRRTGPVIHEKFVLEDGT